ncbi:MAG: hypothetical protein U9M95_00840 [Candidatus Altiarchaeota archaeon]|nr:hypothetical protein [Candidatus Altiarchaeota archaeon]
MWNKISVLLFAAVLLSLSAGALIPVSVSINSDIDGFISYVDVPDHVEDSYQRFTLVWVNSGSVSCRLRTRADVYSGWEGNKSLLYSAWSGEMPSEPGTENTLCSYWFPWGDGNYSVDFKIYYCNLIVDGPQRNFTVERERVYFGNLSVLPTPELLDVSASSNKSAIEFTLKSSEDIDGLLITPSAYPTAWVFESTEVGYLKAGNPRSVKVSYEPTIWKSRNVSFTLVSADGSMFFEHVVELKEKKGIPWESIVLGFLFLLVVFLSVLLFSLGKKNIN